MFAFFAPCSVSVQKSNVDARLKLILYLLRSLQGTRTDGITKGARYHSAATVSACKDRVTESSIFRKSFQRLPTKLQSCPWQGVECGQEVPRALWSAFGHTYRVTNRQLISGASSCPHPHHRYRSAHCRSHQSLHVFQEMPDP